VVDCLTDKFKVKNIYVLPFYRIRSLTVGTLHSNYSLSIMTNQLDPSA